MTEIVRAESRDRTRSTQIGIACELRWKPGAAVPELTMDGGPRILAGLGDPGFSDLHHPAFCNPLPATRDGAPHRRRGRLRVHHPLRARPRTDRRTSRAAGRAGREPDGALPPQALPGDHHRRCGPIRHPLPGLSRTRRARQLIKACLNSATARQQHWRCPSGQVLRRPGQPSSSRGVTGGCRRRGAPAAAREVTQFPDADLDCATGLPGPGRCTSPGQ
jgi:hypothetical protein